MKPDLELVGEITDIETLAIGRAICDLERLRKMYGQGRWRFSPPVARRF